MVPVACSGVTHQGDCAVLVVLILTFGNLRLVIGPHALPLTYSLKSPKPSLLHDLLYALMHTTSPQGAMMNNNQTTNHIKQRDRSRSSKYKG
jgi:hypothetical protein